MLFFSNNNFIKRYLYGFSCIVLFFFFQSCATYKAQYGKNITEPIDKTEETDSLSHRFYLIGDAGNADQKLPKQTLELFEKRKFQSICNL